MHSTYTTFFSPMMMDLISLNTTLLLDHNWFDHSFWYSYSFYCILCYCPVQPRHTVCYSTKTFRQQRWQSSSSSCYFLLTYWVVITAAVNTYHWNIQILPCNRGRFSSVFGGPRSSVSAVQLLIRGKPLPRWLALLSVHFNNHQPMLCRLTCEVL